MNNSSKALVNNTQEFCFDQKEIENLDVFDHGENQLHLIFDNESVVAKVIEKDFLQRKYKIQIDSNFYEITIPHPLDDLIKEMGYSSGSSKIIDSIKAPMPGSIIEIKVKEGQKVKEGETLLILEAMKMENAITSPKDTVIKELFVKEGESVDKNKLLIDFE
ncbi:biotin/lipoyl-binding protein [Lutimonas saemankumensis]|uniref:acetyl-CoA carboxylase biotin carboxyl carrier protein subunit n=1 Tax=Lutimonas saemankumensis TaxID=483016 RepID=UPI001CD37CE2|nr:acetyl-CoA carboxylase biotin carboxyl carrier protein subunit [Lutimonas saemankumensis]MCA0932530.1 biotin/lipoyl-binding protein [Lutimonas saemankumensis]